MLTKEQREAISTLENCTTRQEYCANIALTVAGSVSEDVERVIYSDTNDMERVFQKSYCVIKDNEAFLNVVIDYLLEIQKENKKLTEVFNVLWEMTKDEQKESFSEATASMREEKSA